MPLPAILAAAGPMMQGIASLLEAAKGAPPPSGAGMAQGDASAFGENTQSKMLDQTRGGPSAAPVAGAPPLPPPPSALAQGGPGIAQIAPPQQPIQQPKPAETYSQGVDAPNIAPEVGGSTGGEISKIATPDILGADAAMANQPSPLTSTGPEGGYQALPQGAPPPPPGSQRLQDFMGVAGPAAGMIGAGIGAANSAQRAPGSGGFPARGGWNMPPSLAVASQYNRRRR